MKEKKLIGICVPCYNEVDNVVPLTEELQKMFAEEFSDYSLRIQFIDNNSDDGTQDKLRFLTKKYKNVRAILNARNFPSTSGYYGLITTGGDCTISIPCDFQVPLDNIPKMIRLWENGAKIVCMQKENADESKIMWLVRQLFYFIQEKFSDHKIIKNYYGCGLYDRSFVEFFKSINDPAIAFLDTVNSFGYDMEILKYQHVKRRSGKTKNNLYSLIDIAIDRFTDSSKIGLRFATILGFFIGGISFLIGLIYLILKIIFWDNFIAGMAPVLIGVFFMGAVQLFFIGLLGEYILKANVRLMNRPYVIERERLNFDSDEP